jgi:hypothetical protein
MSYQMKFTDTIMSVERLKNSRLGNPTWLVHFENHEPMRTMADTAWSYEAGNPEWKNAQVAVIATNDGHIRYCTKTS